MKPHTIFENRIIFLQNFFEVEKDECISLIVENPSWLYHKEQYFIDKAKALTELFDLPKRDMISLCEKFPFILGKRLNRFSSLIKRIASYYDVAECKVKSRMLTHPMLMNRGMYFYQYNKLGKEIFEKQWLLECLTDNEPCCFGGYRTFANLVLVINKIESDIGKVVKVYKKKYKDETFIALYIESDNKKFLVSLGSNAVTEKQREDIKNGTPEEKLLESIFGERKITDAQEYSYHEEYICQLNPQKEVPIDDILRMMATLAIYHRGGTVTLNPKGDTYYLADSNDITQCSIETITPYRNDEYYLYINFYKVEPLGNGKIGIKALRDPIVRLSIEEAMKEIARLKEI